MCFQRGCHFSVKGNLCLAKCSSGILRTETKGVKVVERKGRQHSSSQKSIKGYRGKNYDPSGKTNHRKIALVTLPGGLEERHRLDTGNSFWRTIPGVLGVQVRQVGVFGRKRPGKNTLEKESLDLLGLLFTASGLLRAYFIKVFGVWFLCQRFDIFHRHKRKEACYQQLPGVCLKSLRSMFYFLFFLPVVLSSLY